MFRSLRIFSPGLVDSRGHRVVGASHYHQHHCGHSIEKAAHCGYELTSHPGSKQTPPSMEPRVADVRVRVSRT